MGILDMFNTGTNQNRNANKPSGLLTVDPNTGMNMAQVIGAAMMANGRGTTGAGYQNGMNNWQTMLNKNRATNVDTRAAEIHALKMQEHAKQKEQAKAEAAQLSEWIATLPPEQKLAARVNPEKAMAAFHEAKKRNIKSVGDGLYDVNSGQWLVNRTPKTPTTPALEKVIDPKTGKPVLVPRSQASGMQPYTSKGLQFSGDGNGGFTLTQGGSGVNPNGGLMTPANSKPTVNKLQEKQFNAIEYNSRLGEMKNSFNPEYHTWMGQGKQGVLTVMDKLGVASPASQQEIGKYETHKQNVLNSANARIKEITGAAMAEAEAKRLMGELPNMGDGPTAFKTKVENVTRKLGDAMMRYQYAQIHGLNPMGMTGSKGEILQKRGEELIPVYKQKFPDTSEVQMKSAITSHLRREFLGMGQ